MSLTSNDNMVLPVTPMGGYGNGGFGGGWGDGAWWLIVLLLFAGWGNGGYGNGNGGGNGGTGPLFYPFMNQQGAMQDGFNQAATASALAGIQTSITNGFSNAEVAACNRAMTDMQTAHAGQLATLNQSFANQQALAAQLNAMSAAQASCCCENRLGLANLGADIAREACADRQSVNDALRDVITNNTANTQSVLNTLNSGFQSVKDQMYQDKLDAKNERITALENQLNMAQLAASQNAQTAAIIANNEAQTTALENYLNPPARPAYIVPGPCGQTYGSYGFGCGVA